MQMPIPSSQRQKRGSLLLCHPEVLKGSGMAGRSLHGGLSEGAESPAQIPRRGDLCRNDRNVALSASVRYRTG